MSERQIQVSLADYIRHYEECLDRVLYHHSLINEHAEAVKAYAQRLADNEARAAYNQKFLTAQHYRTEQAARLYERDKYCGAVYSRYYGRSLESLQNYTPFDHSRKWPAEPVATFYKDYTDICKLLSERISTVKSIREGTISLSESAAREYSEVKDGTMAKKAATVVQSYVSKATSPLPDLNALLEDTEELGTIPTPWTEVKRAYEVGHKEFGVKLEPHIPDYDAYLIPKLIGIVAVGIILFMWLRA